MFYVNAAAVHLPKCSSCTPAAEIKHFISTQREASMLNELTLF